QALAAILPRDIDLEDRQALACLGKRFRFYIEKALREAKQRTDWFEPNEAYEAVIQAFAAPWFEPAGDDFLADFAASLAPFQEGGAINSLSQTLAKLTAPGIPDFYQGAERLALNLVDPDNRRPVDLEALSDA